jgi:integrase
MSGHLQRRGKNSWRLKFDIGRDPLTNKRRIRYVTLRGTKRDAEKELIRLIAECNAGVSIDPSKTTVSDYLAGWHSGYAVVHVTPKTAERYKQLIKNQIAPHIGQLQLQKLQPAHLQGLYAKLLRVGLAPRTVGHVHRLLRKAIGHAGTMDMVQRNVATLVKPPKADDAEITILTEEQIAKLLAYVKGRTLYPILTLGLATGARRGELLALRIKDFNPEKGTIRIERSLEQTKGQLRFKVPKTRHGKRTIAIPPPVVTELKANIMKVQERRLLLGMGRAGRDDLLFPTWNGQVRSPHWLTQKFALAMAALKIEGVTLHSLRHTHASQLIASGMDVLTISRRLGHGSAAITLRVYGHLIEGKDAQAAEVMNRLFNGLRTE